MWYLDDGTLAGPVDQVRRGWDIIQEEVAGIGLQVNLGKTEWYAPGGSQSPHGGMKTLPPGGFSLLGSPIGSAPFCEAQVAARIHKSWGCIARLENVQNSQVAV